MLGQGVLCPDKLKSQSVTKLQEPNIVVTFFGTCNFRLITYSEFSDTKGNPVVPVLAAARMVRARAQVKQNVAFLASNPVMIFIFFGLSLIENSCLRDLLCISDILRLCQHVHARRHEDVSSPFASILQALAKAVPISSSIAGWHIRQRSRSFSWYNEMTLVLLRPSFRRLLERKGLRLHLWGFSSIKISHPTVLVMFLP